MDVFYPLVYPLKPAGSKHDNMELRYSLRAIEKNLSGFDRVFISTEVLPDWLTNVVHLPVKDEKNVVPDWNIMNKVSKADGLSDDFLFMNDDHFILKPFDATSFPYFHGGSLETYVKKRGLDGYGRRANNTLKHLKKNNLPLKYFDIHYPIIYNREKFKRYVVDLPWDEDGYIIKSLYANAEKIDGVEVKDNKVNHLPDTRSIVYSSHVHIKISIQRFLWDTFPKPSRFEKVA